MKKTINNRFAILQLLLIGMLVFGSALDALAWQRSVTGSRSGNTISRKSVTTGNQGNSVVRETGGAWDSQTKTWNKNATTTGPNGKSIKKSSTATRTNNGYAKESTVTGPQGGSAGRSVEGAWDAETQTWTKTVNSSGRNQ